jgi:hypothetical protein
VNEIVVADPGPLIALRQIDRLDFLRQLYGRVTVPPEVAREVAPSVGSLSPWVDVRRPMVSEPDLPPRRGLDEGEFQAFALAIELRADLVVVDDREARRWARTHGLPITGIAGVALRAMDKGLVSEIRPLLDGLIAPGVYLGHPLYLEVLETAGERLPGER